MILFILAFFISLTPPPYRACHLPLFHSLSWSLLFPCPCASNFLAIRSPHLSPQFPYRARPRLLLHQPTMRGSPKLANQHITCRLQPHKARSMHCPHPCAFVQNVETIQTTSCHTVPPVALADSLVSIYFLISSLWRIVLVLYLLCLYKHPCLASSRTGNFGLIPSFLRLCFRPTVRRHTSLPRRRSSSRPSL
jgi:hypothetical protein